MSDMKSEKEKAEAEEHRDERIEKTGQITLQDHAGEQKIHLLTIIGEVEGHENLAGNSKTTKYEPVSYTHLRAPRDRTRSRMPSSA